MRHFVLPLMLCASMLGCAQKTTPLFNGKDLAGWAADVPAADKKPDIAPTFIVRNNLLVSLGNPEGHLVTEKEYRDYRLDVEYRFAKGPGNCGVLVHASKPRALYAMFPQSIECQMLSGNAGDFWVIKEDIETPNMVERRGPKEKWGSSENDLRRIKNLTDNSEKPVGDWNHMRIECRGRAIKVWVNGDLVNDGSNCTTDHGKIALQAEGAEVEFRRVDLTPLAKTP